MYLKISCDNFRDVRAHWQEKTNENRGSVIYGVRISFIVYIHEVNTFFYRYHLRANLFLPRGCLNYNFGAWFEERV